MTSIPRRFLPYSVAVASTAISLGLSLWLDGITSRMLGSVFFIAIAVTTWYGGMPPGLVAIGLAELSINYFFIPPLYHLQINNAEDIARLLLFGLVAGVITILSNNLRNSRRQIEQLSRQVLDESANRLQTALNSAQMGLWSWNLITGEVMWSPEHEQLFGFPLGSFDGTYAMFEERLHPDDRTDLHQALTHALQNRIPYHHEFRVVWADGSIHWIEGRGHATYAATGEPVRMSGTIMAIDQRKHAEIALQERETILRLFAQRAPAGIAMLDRNMVYLMASQQWVDEYNLGSLDSIIHRSHYEVFPEIPDRWRAIHQRCLAGAIEKCEDDLFIRADGTYQWISWEIRPWYTANQDIGGIMIFSVDITQRKQAEEALRQSEARLRLAQVASDSAVWDWDVQTHTVIWSPEYYQLYRLDTTVEPSYENWLQCVHPDDRVRADQQTRHALDSPSTELRVEFRVLQGDEIRWFADIGQVFRNDRGETIRVVGITIDITQQKHNELALQTLMAELEQRVAGQTFALQQVNNLFSNFFEAASSANIGLCIHDLDLRFVQINQALADINGFTIEEHLGKTTTELMPQLALKINPLLQQVLLTGQAILNRELAAEAPSQIGHLRYWLLSFFPVLQQEGPPQTLGVGVIVIEISDRKRAETVLHQKNRLEQLRWNISQSIRQSLDLNAILYTAVEQMRQTLQVDRVAVYRFHPDWSGDFIAESAHDEWLKLVDSDISKVWEDTYLQETQGGRFRQHETCVVSDIYTAGLQPCHIELLEQFQAKAYAVAPIFSGQHLWGLLAIYQNRAARTWQAWEVELLQQIASQLSIAIQQSYLYSQLQIELQERQQTEAVLREAERRWRSLLDNVQLIVVGLDQSGHINYANPFFFALTGYTESEVIGKNWFSIFVPPARQHILQSVFAEIIHQNAHPYYQDCILTKAGEERFIAWNNTWLQHLDGTVMGTISIGEDITERQKVEKIKDEFIGIVSHELRTPLTAIQMSLGLLRTGVYAKNPDKSQRMIEIALSDTNRLVNLVNDILDLERLESGRLTLEKTVCDAGELMRQAVEGVQAIAKQQAVQLHIVPTNTTVWAAADTIIQTLTNLVSNAIKFSPPHGTVQIQADQQADYVLFQVSDQGRGIPDDKLEVIFGRFQQVDVSDSREKGGTGLGLPICRSIIERHGGKIWAESTVGQGSTFFFTLPLPPEGNL